MSEVAICNEALSMLGAPQIISLADETPNASRCQALYPSSRDAVLEAHDWQFAKAQARLVREAVTPEFGYEHQFVLPPDCFVVTWAGQRPDSRVQLAEWERVGDRLYANLMSTLEYVYIWYTRRVTDTALFSPGFRKALSAYLAAELAFPITESTTREERMWAQYGRKVQAALGAEGQQGRTRVTRSGGEILKRRGGAAFGFFETGRPGG